MNTGQFVEALSDYALNPTEIADILWLALRQPQEDFESEPEEDNNASQPPKANQGAQDDNGQSSSDNFGDETEEAPNDDQKDDRADIASVPSGILPPNALPISVPDPGFLEETLPLVRALRPLLKQIASETASHINEAATVDRIAETDIWSPVLEPDREPWFEVALVIDGSAGMALWKRLIQDIRRLLQCYGSFRDSRVWELVANRGEIGVCAVPDRSVRNPRALLTPNGRRLTLVFSDCTADYWWDGSLQPILSLWGHTMPTAIWQVLPDWMWKRTALGVGEYVAIRNRIPGASNQDLKPTFLSLRPPKRLAKQSTEESISTSAPGSAICLPVITTDGASIGAWSRMLAGDRRQSTPGFVLPAEGWERVSERPSHTSDQQLEQFRLRATPEARHLAALLSAAPVITLPVMRLIRASMLSGTSPLPVAEVFLGGLLQRSADQPEVAEAELVQYDFPAETREHLLDILPSVEAISVIEAVSQYVAERLNCTLADFRALLLFPDLRTEADLYGLKTFAQVTAQILRKLGSEYAELAAQFDSPVSVEPGGAKEWPDFPLQTFEYDVAEFRPGSKIEDFG